MNSIALDNIDIINNYNGENYLISEGKNLSLIDKDDFNCIDKLKYLEYPIYYTYHHLMNYIEMDKSLQYRQKKYILYIIDNSLSKLITIIDDYHTDEDDYHINKDKLYAIINNIIERYDNVTENIVYKNKKCEYMIYIMDDIIDGFKTAGKYLYFNPVLHDITECDNDSSDNDSSDNDSSDNDSSENDSSENDSSDKDNESDKDNDKLD